MTRDEAAQELWKRRECSCRACIRHFLNNNPGPGMPKPGDVVQDTPQAAQKFDDKKLRMDLLPPLGVEAAARAMTYGAKKYGDRNWEKGLAPERLLAATLRHLFAFLRDEQWDDESNLSHLDHAAASLLMLIDTMERTGRMTLRENPLAQEKK